MRKTDPAKVQQQRDHILRAAMKCFSRKGVHGTSTDDICRAAKISSGTLYYYFKSRDGLIHDVIVHAHATRDALLNDLGDAPDLLDVVINVQRDTFEAIAAQGISNEVFIELLAYSMRNPTALAAFHEATVRVKALLMDAVRAHQAAGKLPRDMPAISLMLLISLSALGSSIMEITDAEFDIQEYRKAMALALRREQKQA